MHQFKFENRTPPGGWVYAVPETGGKIRGASLDALVCAVADHCNANGVPVKPHGRQTIIETICASAPDACQDKSPSTMTQVKSFVEAMVGWAHAGFKVVRQDTFLARADTCRACDYWRGWSGAFGHGRCKKCGCTSLKLYLPGSTCAIGRWGPEQ